MSKDAKIYRIDQCPDVATMEAYMDGRLDKDLVGYIDAHAEECPLCADAIDGLRMRKSEQPLSEITSDLNRAVDQRVRKNESKKIYWLSAAAVLFIALISGYLFIRITDIRKERNVTEAIPDVSVQLPVPGNMTDQSAPKEIQNNTDKEESTAQTSVLEKQTENEGVSETAITYSDEQPRSEAVAEEKKSVIMDELQEPAGMAGKKDERRDADLDDANQKDVLQAKPAVASTTITDKNRQEVQTLPSAPAAEDSRSGALTRSYDESETRNKAKKSAEKTEVIADPVELAYQQRDHKKVIELTGRKKDLKNNSKNKWLRANSLIVIGKSSEAIPLLKELVNSSNPYSSRSEELLRTLSKEDK